MFLSLSVFTGSLCVSVSLCIYCLSRSLSFSLSLVLPRSLSVSVSVSVSVSPLALLVLILHLMRVPFFLVQLIATDRRLLNARLLQALSKTKRGAAKSMSMVG